MKKSEFSPEQVPTIAAIAEKINVTHHDPEKITRAATQVHELLNAVAHGRSVFLTEGNTHKTTKKRYYTLYWVNQEGEVQNFAGRCDAIAEFFGMVKSPDYNMHYWVFSPRRWEPNFEAGLHKLSSFIGQFGIGLDWTKEDII